jgi:preprotein translocase subunit SecD
VDRSIKWRALVVALALVAAFIGLYPTLAPKDKATNEPQVPAWWKKILPINTLVLGLDLQGGMHLVLEVQVEKAVDGALERTIEELKLSLLKEKLATRAVNLVEGSRRIEVRLARVEDQDKLNKILDKEYGHLSTSGTVDDEGGLKVTLEPVPRWLTETKENAVRQALQTITSRIDQMGLTEPDIRPQGADRIVVQLPGVKDPEQAKSLLTRVAHLEFKLVDESRTPEAALAEGLPPGTEVLYEMEKNKETGREKKTAYLLKKRALMDGSNITEASVAFDRFNSPYVSLSFNATGARQFEHLTEAHVKKRLAIILDNRVYSAPVIQEKIGGGRAQISGNFSMEEARDLAIVLRSGALPAPVIFLEERTVGASLGEDSIRQGFQAFLVGWLLVVVFMAVYYKAAGLIADLCVLLNMVFTMAMMGMAGATLTLPGIAGLILTIGMSVDANVLIFERIREEIRLGKSPRAAVDAGFEKALWTIVDSNVTTLIAAIVLFQFGTGPIRGFAVTLTIGLTASMFTAIFVARLIFDFFMVKRGVKTVSI